MRVISGFLKNRRLLSAHQLNIRPATDRVKETIFNVLQTRFDMNGAIILDLFAGTGSLGIEAISRGAEKAIFVDNSFKTCQIIKQNIKNLSIQRQCEVINTDAFKFINQCQEKFDLIFADPPYTYENTINIPLEIFSKKLLNKEGILIIEHTNKTTFNNLNLYNILVQKKFGNTIVTFFKNKKEE